jgi:hypothetical protein
MWAEEQTRIAKEFAAAKEREAEMWKQLHEEKVKTDAVRA